MAVPQEARTMYMTMYDQETAEMPTELTFVLDLIQNEAVTPKIDTAEDLFESIQRETLFIEEAAEEQAFARTLLRRFGLPYLPGAEKVWVMLSEYLTNAKEATEQAQAQLEQTIEQVKALLTHQLTIEKEEELEELHREEKQHLAGTTLLQETNTALLNEDELAAQKDEAIDQKEERLRIISVQKIQIKSSIESMRAMVSNLIASFSGVKQFDKTQLVMA